MHLQESGEMYLETILILSKTKNGVRSVDVGEYMGFSKPSVSRAVGLLKNGGYIIVDAGGFLSLTDSGKKNRRKNLRTAYSVDSISDALRGRRNHCV